MTILSGGEDRRVAHFERFRRDGGFCHFGQIMGQIDDDFERILLRDRCDLQSVVFANETERPAGLQMAEIDERSTGLALISFSK